MAVPSAPFITYVAHGNASLSVVFTAPTSDGGATITNYKYSTDGGTTWITRSPTATTSPISITGLTNGTQYTVVIRAVNSSGDGDISSSVLATPGVPNAPTITGSTSLNASATITFTDPVGNGGFSVSNYAYSIDEQATWTALSPTDATSPITITGLTNGTTYSIYIRAINSFGSGYASNNTIVNPTNKPTSPTITSITPSNQTLTVAFTDPSYDGGSSITNYEYSLDAGMSWTASSPTVTSSPLTISGLSNGVTYAVIIRAVTSNGSGQSSNSLSGTPATVPGAPSIFSISPSDGALIISVTPPLDNGGAPIYYYQYSLDSGTTWSEGLPETPLRATGLVNGTSYSVTVRAGNLIGVGDASTAVSSVPASRDYILSMLNRGLTPIHAEQDRYNFAPKLAGDIRILLEDQANYLTFNTIDSSGNIWVISDIDGWWTLPDIEMPDIQRGFGDGSFDITGRNLARNITLNGSVLVTESTRTNISSANTSIRQQLVNAFNLVKRGTWLIVDEDSYKRASYVRLSGKPNISTINNRGRIDFSIGLKAADPTKYEWIEGTSSNVPTGTEAVANGYNVKIIGEYGYKNSVTEMYTKYGKVDDNPSTTENYRDYGNYGKVDYTVDDSEYYRQYNLGTAQTGVSGTTTVTNAGTTNVYCYFRIVGPLFGPAEITNITTGQTINILAPTALSGTNQVLTPDETTSLVEYLDIDTRSREVHTGSFQNGQSSGSSRGLLDPVVSWIYLQPGENTISFTDYGTDVPTLAPQLQIYWRSGWSG